MKNRVVIYIITVLLMVVGIYFGMEHIKEDNPAAFRVKITSDEHTEHIDYWQGPDGCIYVFLPGYVAFEDAVIDLETTNDVYINQLLLEEGMSCSAFEKDCFYDFTYTSWGKEYSYQLKFIQSANVATMYIDTASGNMEYIHRLKGNEESGSMVLYTADGQLDYEGNVNALNGRGNDTWSNYEKKPYSVKLDNAADLLQMGMAQKWILLANAKDASNLNNKIVYDFADKVGLSYAPDAEWVDLYLNDEYMGLYLLCERIEIDESRVDIEATTQEVGSSYVVSQEIVERLTNLGEPYITTEAGVGLRIHEPSEITNEQIYEIASQFQVAERGIMAFDGVDPQTGTHYTDIIDMDSWVRKYLLEEIFMNIDAGYGSQYFYSHDKSVDDKIYAGPVWDYDHALARQRVIAPDAMIANREYARVYGYTPWFYELYQKEEFYRQIVKIYTEEYKAELAYLRDTQLPIYVEKVRTAAEMNHIRWFMNTDENFDQNVEDIFSFLDTRIAFLDKMWIDNMECNTVRVETEYGYFYTYYTVPVGEKIKELPEIKAQEKMCFVGWYHEDTDLPFDITQPIYEDMQIYPKWEPVDG